MLHSEVHIRLPDWADEVWAETRGVFPSDADRMEFVIKLARQNVTEKTGGPFGAAVFDDSGSLVAPGVNVVVPSHCSILHAEIVALALAESILGRYDIGDAGRLRYDLVSSTEPCAMCSGAILWSGVSRLVCGARDEDARSIGFDEGPKLPDWIDQFKSRGISVERDVLRDEAIGVLRTYAASGGLIYNSGENGETSDH